MLLVVRAENSLRKERRVSLEEKSVKTTRENQKLKL